MFLIIELAIPTYQKNNNALLFFITIQKIRKIF